MQYIQGRNIVLVSISSLKAYLIHQTDCWRVSLSCSFRWLLEVRTSTRQKRKDTVTNKNEGWHTSHILLPLINDITYTCCSLVVCVDFILKGLFSLKSLESEINYLKSTDSTVDLTTCSIAVKMQIKTSKTLKAFSDLYLQNTTFKKNMYFRFYNKNYKRLVFSKKEMLTIFRHILFVFFTQYELYLLKTLTPLVLSLSHYGLYHEAVVWSKYLLCGIFQGHDHHRNPTFLYLGHHNTFWHYYD